MVVVWWMWLIFVFFDFAVPQQKSMKLMKVLSKPREINASPSLLMIAPSSDKRYRSIAFEELARSNTLMTQPMTLSQPKIVQKIPNTTSTRSGSQQMWPNTANVKQSLLTSFNSSESLPTRQNADLSAPCYLQQLSTLAAMAWSDCTKVTEKLRRIYEQTTSLKDLHPKGVPRPAYYQSPPESFNIKQNLVATPQVAEYYRSSNYAMQNSMNFSLTSSPAHHCICATCRLNRNVQSSAAMSSDVKSNLMTSNVVNSVSQLKTSYETASNGQVRSQLKRALSPSDLPGHQIPVKKLMRTPYYGDVGTAVMNEEPLTSFKNASCGNDIACAPRVVSNFFFRPSVQMTSSPLRSCEFMVAPVLNQCNYVQSFQSGVGNLPRFNDIFHTRVPNVIK